MQPPETHYAKSGEAHIAYQIVGDGPIDLLFAAEWLNHIDEQWEEPRLARFLEGLARFSRLILFNPRGMGASDPIPASRAPTAEEWMDDALAALDAATSERAAVLGTGAGGTIALLLSAAHPDRVSSLIVFNTGARTAWDEDYPMGMPREYLRRAQEQMEADYPSPGILTLWAPDLVGDEHSSGGSSDTSAYPPARAPRSPPSRCCSTSTYAPCYPRSRPRRSSCTARTTTT